MKDKAITTKKFEKFTLQFYKNYVVSIVKEDIIFSFPEIEKCLQACEDFFQNKLFTYVVFRKNNYNVDPMIYIKTLKYAKNLSGVAIVCPEHSKINNAKFEKQFMAISCKIFTSLEPAVEWSNSLTTK